MGIALLYHLMEILFRKVLFELLRPVLTDHFFLGLRISYLPYWHPKDNVKFLGGKIIFQNVIHFVVITNFYFMLCLYMLFCNLSAKICWQFNIIKVNNGLVFTLVIKLYQIFHLLVNIC